MAFSIPAPQQEPPVHDILTLTPLWRPLLMLCPLGLVLLVAAWTDLRQRKVYNKLTYPAILVGLLVHTVAMGLDGLLAGLAAAGLTLVLGLLVITTGWIRGGDIKLLIAVGAFLGLRGLFEVFFYSVLAGLFIGLGITAANGFLRQMFQRVWHMIRDTMLMLIYRTKNLAPTFEPDERSKMPFAIAILAGGALTVTEHLWGWPGLLTWYMGKLNF